MLLRIFLLLAAGTLSACQPPPPREALDAHELRIQLQQLAGVAAEADLLTREMAGGHLDRSFAWVHQQALADQAGQAASSLVRTAPASLQPVQRQAVQLAGDLRLVVTRIAGAQDDPAALQALRRELSGLGAQARRIADAATS